MYGKLYLKNHIHMNTKTSDKFSIYAKNRALYTTLVLALWFFLVLAYYPFQWFLVWPLIFFYSILLVNTFFSIRSFASLTPKENIIQQAIDVLLFLSMVALPVLFFVPIIFIILTLFLFITATLKYIFLVLVVGFSKLLYWKIKVDTLGILLCFLTLVGILFGFEHISIVIFALTFFLANIYVLWWNPLYILELHEQVI